MLVKVENPTKATCHGTITCTNSIYLFCLSAQECYTTDNLESNSTNSIMLIILLESGLYLQLGRRTRVKQSEDMQIK